MNEPTISIIIPVFNIEAYLPGCLDSVIAQTYRNLEIIIVDDGSKDDTPFIADQYAVKDPRIRVIHQENSGVTSARLNGAASASGEYIGFVDGDDYIEPDMFRRLIENAIKYRADISHCGYRMVFHNRVDMYYGTGRLVEQDHETGLRDLLTGAFIEPSLVNKLYCRKLFDGLLHENVIDPTIRNHEDLLLNYYLFRKARKAVFEDVCPYHYLVRGDSAANRQLNSHQLLDPLRVMKIIMRETEGQSELHGIAFRRLVRLQASLATKELALNPELIRPNRKQARKELRCMLPDILKSRYMGLKLKTMALGAAVFPAAYQWIHKAYARATGSDKKYDLG